MFAAEGAAVVVTGRHVDRGRAVVEAIEGSGGRAVFVAADLSSEDACAGLANATVDALGGLTVLVNNAAAVDGATDGPAGDIATPSWEHILRVNLTASMWLCRAAIPHMARAGHGSIVNVSSRAGERGTPGHAAYTASKGGLNALTRSIAVDYAAAGIRCNTVSPGYVLNERRDADLTDERRATLAGMHLTRLGQPSAVA